jgi:hypothetical protein
MPGSQSSEIGSFDAPSRMGSPIVVVTALLSESMRNCKTSLFAWRYWRHRREYFFGACADAI